MNTRVFTAVSLALFALAFAFAAPALACTLGVDRFTPPLPEEVKKPQVTDNEVLDHADCGTWNCSQPTPPAT